MKSLAEHNRDASRKYEQAESYMKPLEVECPKCGAPIVWDSRQIIMSQPPQVNANCTTCCWHGTIVRP